MVVYVELIFLVNLAADLTLSVVTLRAVRETVRPLRIALSSVVGAAASVLYVYFPMGLWFKILLSIVIVLFLAHWKNLKSLLKGLVAFYFISALYAGVAEFFMNFGFGEIIVGGGTVDISPVLTAAAFVAATLIAEGAFSTFYQRRKVVCRLYRVDVSAGEYTVRTEGFYDTGNTLREDGSPVVVLSKTLAEKLRVTAEDTMPVATVTGIRILKKLPLTVKIYYGRRGNRLYKAQGVVSDEPLKAPVILNSEFEEEL